MTAGKTYYFTVVPVAPDGSPATPEVASPVLRVDMPQRGGRVATRGGGSSDPDRGWYRVSLPASPYLTRNEARYTGYGQAQVGGSGIVLAESIEAAVFKAVDGIGTITSPEAGTRTYEVADGGGYKVGTVLELESFVNDRTPAPVGIRRFDRPPGVPLGQRLLSLEDTYEWTYIDKDYDDFYWQVNVQRLALDGLDLKVRDSARHANSVTNEGTLEIVPDQDNGASIDVLGFVAPDTADARQRTLWQVVDTDGGAVVGSGNFGGADASVSLGGLAGGEYRVTAGYDENGDGTLATSEVMRTIAVELAYPDVPVVRLETLLPDAYERGSVPGRIVVTRYGDPTRSLNVGYAASGTAGRDVDYIGLPPVLTIPAGQQSTTYDIVPFDDLDQEGDESVTLRLEPHPSYLLGDSAEASVLIRDDETPGSPGAPDAPLLGAWGTSQSVIRLDWRDPFPDTTGWRVEWSTSGMPGGWQPLSTPAAAARSEQHTGLAPQSQLYYRVAAVRPSGLLAWSNVTRASTWPVETGLMPPPAAPDPTGDPATEPDVTGINPSPSDPPPAAVPTGGIPPVGPGGGPGNPGGGGPPASDPDPTEGQEPDRPKAPLAPAELKGVAWAGVDGGVILADWADKSDDEEGFVVQFSTSDDFSSPISKNADANHRSVTLEGLACSTAYYIRVKAFNDVGPSEWSETATVVTPIPASEVQVEALSDTEIQLSWECTSYNGAQFVIERQKFDVGAQDPNEPQTEWREIARLQGSETSYLDTDLEEATKYNYRICVRTDDASSNLQIIVTGWTKPKRPENLTAEFTSFNGFWLSRHPAGCEDGCIVPISNGIKANYNLKWNDNSDHEDNYVLEWSDDNINWTGWSYGSRFWWTTNSFQASTFETTYAENTHESTITALFPSQYDDEPVITRYARVRAVAGQQLSEPSAPIEIVSPAPTAGSDKPVVSISARNAYFHKGEGDSVPIDFVVNRSGKFVKNQSTQEIEFKAPATKVYFWTPSGNASSGQDYSSFPSEITVPQDTPSATFTVNLIDDSQEESLESVEFGIRGSSSYILNDKDWNNYSDPTPYRGGWSIEDNDWVDLDIDSNNSDGLKRPSRAVQDEDTHEDTVGMSGKRVLVNDWDGDHDGVPAWADGFDRFENTYVAGSTPFGGSYEDSQDDRSPDGSFVPLNLALAPGIDWSVAKVKFQYPASDPAGVDRTGTGKPHDPYVYTLPAGKIRLWSSSSPYGRDRDKASVADGGQFIRPGEVMDAAKLRGGVLVEAVRESGVGEVLVEVMVDPDGSGNFVRADKVRLTTVRLDVDPGLAAPPPPGGEPTPPASIPDEDAAEDQQEDHPQTYGSVLVVNDGDADADGVADFADGYDDSPGGVEAAHRFAPLKIRLPEGVDPLYAALRIDYDASDPAAVEKVGDGENAGYRPAEDGYLRLWVTDGNEPRNPRSALSGGGPAGPGEWVKPGVYGGDDLARFEYNEVTRTITLYVEAVRATPDANPAATTVTIAVDPDGGRMSGCVHGAPEWEAFDSVKFTAVQAYAPDAEGTLVRPADGAASWSSTDFETFGYGGAWGQGRAWSTAHPALLDGLNGNGFASTYLPELTQAGSTMVAVLDGVAHYFDVGADGYKARFGGLEQLHKKVDHYLLTLPDGSRFKFNTFDAATPAAARGAFRAYLDAGGNETVVSEKDPGSGRITEVQRGATTIDYSYFTESDGEDFEDFIGLLKTATLTNSKGNWKATYAYYPERNPAAGEFQGNLRDLKSVEIEKDGALYDRKYYRYSRNASNPDGPSRLYAVLEAAAAARLRGKSGTSVEVSPVDVANAEFEEYANVSFAYDARGRVEKVRVQGAGASAENGAAAGDVRGSFSYKYVEQKDAAGEPAGSGTPPEADRKDGLAGVNVWKQKTLETLPDGTEQTTYTNHAGQAMLSVASLADGRKYRTYYHMDRQGRVDLISMPSATQPEREEDLSLTGPKATEGLVHKTEYYPEDDERRGYVKRELLSRGENGEQATQREFTYYAQTFEGVTIRPLKEETTYRELGGGSQVVLYAYSDWQQFQPQKVQTYLPQVFVNQNGSGFPESETRWFNGYGQLVKVQDPDLKVHTYDPDADTGVVKTTVVDAEGANPLALTTIVKGWDLLGRPKEIQDPNGNIRTTIGYAETPSSHTTTTTWPGVGQIEIVREDLAAGTVETEVTVPDGTTKVVTRETLDRGGRTVFSERILDPDPVSGAAYRTDYKYDAGGRLSYTKDAAGTERDTAFDGLGRPTSEKVGGVEVQTFEYDGAQPTGDGNLTKLTLHPGGGEADRVTTYGYDWRNRLRATRDGFKVAYSKLDNAGNAVVTSIFDQAGVPAQVDWSAADPVGNFAGALRAKTEASFDNRGRVFSTKQIGVDPDDGAISGQLETRVFYDGRDNPIISISPTGLVSETRHDGAGRPVFQSVGDGTEEAQRVETQYDANGNPVLMTTTRFGAGGPRTTHVASYYDAVDRIVSVADIGPGPVPSLVVPPPRTAALVTNYEYDRAGNLKLVTDPRGVPTFRAYDALGRVAQEVENGNDWSAYGYGAVRKTAYGYNGLDQPTVVTAYNYGEGATSANGQQPRTPATPEDAVPLWGGRRARQVLAHKDGLPGRPGGGALLHQPW